MFKKVVIVCSDYYPEIYRNLLEGALNYLEQNEFQQNVHHGAYRIERTGVDKAPGCFEIPFLINEKKYLMDCIDTTWISSQGEYILKFEKALADYHGMDQAIVTSSCTTALHLSMAALGVGPGDEVLVPDFTFPATANAVIQTGATPVFVDSSTKDFGMDPECAASLVSGRTRVIMPVDPFGQPADHQALTLLAADAGAHLVVDAACSLGAVRDNRKCGAHGDLSCFSFHPRKVVTCGEGGMVTTNSPDLAARL